MGFGRNNCKGIELKILITCPRTEISKSIFDNLFSSKSIEVDYIFPQNQNFNSKEMEKIYKNHEILIVGDDEIDQEFLNKTSSLRHIIKWGKGTDNIDKEFCVNNNITVHNSPGKLAKYVAEHGMSLINSLNKNIQLNINSIKDGKWYKQPSMTLFNKTIGFYGFGEIANEFVKLLKPYNVNIIFHDIKTLNNNFKQLSLEEVFINSDVLIVSSELTKDNEGEINSNLIEKMDENSIIINISRGKIINEQDLICSLKNKSIRGAGLDVFNEEPISYNHEFLELENVVVTCHNASNTDEASKEVNKEIVKMVDKLL